MNKICTVLWFYTA